MKRFFVMFGVELLVTVIVVMDFRAVAVGSYPWTASVNALFGVVNFTLVQRIAKSDTRGEMAGYTCGCVVGSCLGIFITKHLKGY